jgi:hypothetical protein
MMTWEDWLLIAGCLALVGVFFWIATGGVL